MSQEKSLNLLNEISEIVLTNPTYGELSLMKVNDDKLESEKKYKEVFISDFSLISGNVSQAAIQVANQGITLAQIAKQAPEGLFAATANPANLSKFANGTTSTMLRDASGHLVGHAGFAEIGLNVSVNPAIILSAGMQVLSAISGTYYLHEINTQIKNLDTKLEDLINIHHDTNIGRLVAARKGLFEIASREFVDTVDLSDIRNYKKTADEIHEEYTYRLKRQVDELNKKNNKKIEEKKHKDIYFAMSIAFESDKLSLYAELIEIGTRMKIGGQTEIITGLTAQLKQNYSRSYYRNIDSEVENTYSIMQQRSSKELNEKNMEFEESLDKFTDLSTWTRFGVLPEIGMRMAVAGKAKLDVNKVKVKVELENQNLNTAKNGLREKKESVGIDRIINEIVELENKEKEILYIPAENNKQRIFVLDENEQRN